MNDGEVLLALPACFDVCVRKSSVNGFLVLSQPSNDAEDSEVWIHPIQLEHIIAALQKFADANK